MADRVPRLEVDCGEACQPRMRFANAIPDIDCAGLGSKPPFRLRLDASGQIQAALNRGAEPGR